jgi:hypothetical protein
VLNGGDVGTSCLMVNPTFIGESRMVSGLTIGFNRSGGQLDNRSDKQLAVGVGQSMDRQTKQLTTCWITRWSSRLGKSTS